MEKPRQSTNVDQYVGMRLRTRRSELKMSQTELGQSVGVTFQQIQKYEKGSNRIGASRLWEFCRVLDVDIGWFFEGLNRSDDEPKAVDVDSAFGRLVASHDGPKFVEALDSIDDVEIRRSLLLFTRALAGLVQEAGKAPAD